MDPKDLREGFNKMLNAETVIRRKTKFQKNVKKTQFISIINKYSEALDKSIMMQSYFMIDLSNYEETFYNVFDEMIMLAWGPDVYSLIAFFFYERLNDDGTENFIVGEDGSEIFIKTANDLYEIINKLYPETFSK